MPARLDQWLDWATRPEVLPLLLMVGTIIWLAALSLRSASRTDRA